MTNSDAINQTLEMVGEKVGDPAPLVYERLFKQRPDLEEMFFMDSDGGVRGSMLQQCFDCLFDAAGEGILCSSVLPSESQRHVEYGVEADLFISFFTTIRDTCKEVVAGDWTPDMDSAWDDLLKQLEGVHAKAA
ncbi:MAG: globin [Candidatus Phaeomarinobacter sp.]